MAPSSKWCRAVTSHTALWPAFPRPASPLLVLKYCVAVLWEVFLFSGTSLVFWANVLGLVYVIGHYNTSFLFGTLWVTGHTTAALVCGVATDSLCVMIVWSLYQAVFTEPGFVPTAAASPLQHCSWEDRPALLGLPEIQQLRHETEELVMWSEWSSSRAITFKAPQQASVTSSLPPSLGPPPLEDAAHNGFDDDGLGDESPSLGRHSARHASSTVQVADDRNRVTASYNDGLPTAVTGSTSVNDAASDVSMSTAVTVPDSDAANLRPLNVSAELSSGTLCLVKSRAASAASTSLLLTQDEVRQLDPRISTRLQPSLSSVERPMGTQGHQPEPGNCSQVRSEHSSEALYVQYVTTERGPRGDVRYCAKCEMYKPDRSHHCSVCGRCVRGMDHHCPWINNCVGSRNHKSFILFVWYVPVAAFVLWASMLVSYRWTAIDLYNAEVLPQYRAQILPGVDPSVSSITAAPINHAQSAAGNSHQKGAHTTHDHQSGVAGTVRKPRWFWGGKSTKSKPAPLYALHWTAHLFNYFVAFIAFMAWLAMSVFALFQTFLVISNQTTLDRKATQRMGQNDSADLESGLGLLKEEGSDERGAGRAKGGSAGRGRSGRQRRTTQWWVRQALVELFETRDHAVQAARTAGRTMGALLAPWRSVFLSRPHAAFTSPRTCATKNVAVEESVVTLPKVPWYVIIFDVLLMFAPVKTNPFLVKTNHSGSAERSTQEGAASHMKDRECCASAGVHRVRCFRLLALFGLRKSKIVEDEHEGRRKRNSGTGDVADDAKRKKPPPDRGVFALHDRDDPLIVTGNPTEQRGFLQRVLVSVLSFSARRGTTNHRAAHDGQPV